MTVMVAPITLAPNRSASYGNLSREEVIRALQRSVGDEAQPARDGGN